MKDTTEKLFSKTTVENKNTVNSKNPKITRISVTNQKISNNKYF